MLKRFSFILLLGIILLFTSTSVFAQDVESRYLTFSEEGWYNYFDESYPFQNPEEFVTITEGLIDQVCSFLDVELSHPITLMFVDSWYGSEFNREENLICHYADPQTFEWKMVYDLTRLLAPYPQSASLNEGLALYVAYSLTFTEIPQDIFLLYHHKVLKKHLTEGIITGYRNLIANVPTATTFNFEDYKLVSATGYSFVRYLIDTYGFETFMEFYKGAKYQQTYDKVFGKNLETLLDGWVEYFQK